MRKKENKTTLASDHLVCGMTLQAVLWVNFQGVLVLQNESMDIKNSIQIMSFLLVKQDASKNGNSLKLVVSKHIIDK